jgi:hypothetical protein
LTNRNRLWYFYTQETDGINGKGGYKMDSGLTSPEIEDMAEETRKKILGLEDEFKELADVEPENPTDTFRRFLEKKHKAMRGR